MTKRDNRIDFLRVVAAALVVLLHILEQGGISSAAPANTAVYWVAWFLEICGFCAVNCFALITGYVMVDRQIKLKNLIQLWFQILFYSLLISGLFFVFRPETRTLSEVIAAFLPISTKQWWYISAYFLLFFFIPILNTAIAHLPQQTYKKLLIVALFGIGIVDSVIPANSFGLNSGYSALWLIIVYLFGAYVKKYGASHDSGASKWLLWFFLTMLVTLVSKVIIHFATKRIFGEVKFDSSFISFQSITILLGSVFLMHFSLRVRPGRLAGKVISLLAPTSLGIYLIHVHPLFFRYVLKDTLFPLAFCSLPGMLLGVVCATLAIYLGCAVTELLRIQLFRLLRIHKLSSCLAQKITDRYHSFFEK